MEAREETWIDREPGLVTIAFLQENTTSSSPSITNDPTPIITAGVALLTTAIVAATMLVITLNSKCLQKKPQRWRRWRDVATEIAFSKIDQCRPNESCRVFPGDSDYNLDPGQNEAGVHGFFPSGYSSGGTTPRHGRSLSDMPVIIEISEEKYADHLGYQQHHTPRDANQQPPGTHHRQPAYDSHVTRVSTGSQSTREEKLQLNQDTDMADNETESSSSIDDLFLKTAISRHSSDLSVTFVSVRRQPGDNTRKYTKSLTSGKSSRTTETVGNSTLSNIDSGSIVKKRTSSDLNEASHNSSLKESPGNKMMACASHKDKHVTVRLREAISDSEEDDDHVGDKQSPS